MKIYLFCIFLFAQFYNTVQAQKNLFTFNLDPIASDNASSNTEGEIYTNASSLVNSITEGFTSATSVTPLSIHTNTEAKPQSKVWAYNGSWWTVLPSPSAGTYLWRLDGTNWTRMLKLSSSSNTKADCKVVGNITHILLYRGSNTPSQLVSIEHLPATNTYQLWSQRSSLISIDLEPGVETATMDVDGKGRMWVAYAGTSNIHVKWSDFPYNLWSTPITIGSGVADDDICAVTYMPSSGKIGVIWSDQNKQRFGFKTHTDGASPTDWSVDEVPASQSALNVGGGMADDHLNLAVASNGTLYCAVKTRYGSKYPTIALLVRRPNGNWDNLYEIAKNNEGTTPIVILNETIGKLKVVYIPSDSGGDIVYKESDISNISFSSRNVLMSGNFLYPSSTKQNYNSDILILASNNSSAYGVLGVDVSSPPPTDDTAPTVESINRQLPLNSNTTTTSVTYRVNFSEKVTGVDASDFTVKTVSGTVTGTLTSNSVESVGTTGTTFDVIVSSITGTGVLRLDLKTSDTGITDESGNVITTGFTTGQTYTIEQLQQYSLTVTATGSGTVTKNPDQATYTSSSNVTLTAIPETNYKFDGWSGDASGSTNPLSITMTGNKSITAAFSPISDQQQVLSFTLVDSNTEKDIQNITDGAIIDLATLPSKKLNIRANTSPSSVGSVKFALSGTQSKTYTDNAAPLCFAWRRRKR